jgi:hypothetical protein
MNNKCAGFGDVRGGMEWLLPWDNVADDAQQVAGMQRELQREVTSGHPLFGLPVRTLGRRQDCDDVLFAIEDGSERVAVVHLTYTRNPPDQPPFPWTVVYKDLLTWAAEGMRADHQKRFS